MRTRIAILMLLAAGVLPSDVKYTQEMGAGPGAGPNAGPAGRMPPMRFTVYVKGKQERRDMNMEAMGMNISTITNCEKSQTITINSKCKLYLVSPMDSEGGSMPSMGGRGMPERKGGLVVVENEFRDTGEHKTMLGREARHVVMKMKMDAGEGACQPGHTEVENDLWMVEVDAHLACQPKSWERPPQGGVCQDRFQVKTKGNESMSRGLPVLSKFTTHLPNGQPQSFTMEVKELTVGPLESSLFEIPAGFREAKSQQELYMCAMGSSMGSQGGPPGGNDRVAATMEAAREARKNAEATAGEAMESAKAAGVLRIGVVLSGSAGASSSAELADQLVGDIAGMDGFDAVRINARAPSEAQQEAVQKKCDFLLYADLAETKPSAGSRLGGILGRAARGDTSGAAKHNVRLDYRLTVAAAPGDEVARDTMNNSFTDEDGPFAMLQQTADRAASDARRWKKKKN